MAIRCQPCQAVIGAEVEGVDLRQVPDAVTIDVLEEALERYGVLIFHAQHLTPAEQVAWSRAFGPLAMTGGLRHACRTGSWRMSRVRRKSQPAISLRSTQQSPRCGFLTILRKGYLGSKVCTAPAI